MLTEKWILAALSLCMMTSVVTDVAGRDNVSKKNRQEATNMVQQV